VRILLAYLLIKTLYPLIFIYGLFILKSGFSLHAKASLFHIVDIFWVLWISHCAFDPLTALSFMLGQNNTAGRRPRFSYPIRDINLRHSICLTVNAPPYLG